MLDPFKRHSKVSTEYFRSGSKMKKILLSRIVAVVIATEFKQFQLNHLNCDDHICIQVFVLPQFKLSSSLVSKRVHDFPNEWLKKSVQ